MKTMGLLVLLSLAACALANKLPRNSECSSSEECAAGLCCLSAGGRWGKPSCQPLQSKDANCRPGNPLLITDQVLSFPDGSKFKVRDAHQYVCPCAENLDCKLVPGGAQCKED